MSSVLQKTPLFHIDNNLLVLLNHVNYLPHVKEVNKAPCLERSASKISTDSQ